MTCRASDFPREYDGACVQMRMSYSPAAQFFLFFVQWSDCHLAGALGLLRILIFQVKISKLFCKCFICGIPDIISIDTCLHKLTGLWRWHHHHVYTWKEGEHKRILWYGLRPKVAYFVYANPALSRFTILAYFIVPKTVKCA